MPDFARGGERLVLDSVFFGREDLSALGKVLPAETLASVRDFLREWFSDAPSMRLQTSGSTGAPKEFFASKARMRQSARLTCGALGLQAGDSALVCLPLDFIAGKMMLVRALVARLDLRVIPPSGHPLADVDRPFDFSAMTPMQVGNSLRSPSESARLARIGTLLIGGAAIPAAMEAALKRLPGAIHATYGMTETLSHIALRRIGASRYIPFPSVTLTLGDDGALLIDAPLVCAERLVTRDVARLHTDGSFEILGRLDNVINTGGVKVHIEEMENRLSALIAVPFAVTAIPHEIYGEAIVLLVQGRCEAEALEKMRAILPAAMMPKAVFSTDALPMTPTGKICRAECRKMAESLSRAAMEKSL
ncbi:MAG: AMP-binding protein [Zoogloeaceae bacterium]|jgi:O-succinylbenzoic acid--CoA ligase|nr:AMP-binding protein [Zoogloeaceae bacterium]